MESISELLSPLDDFEIICEEHGIPCIGICSNEYCKERVKFLCMKCIKSDKTCITKFKHELITLSEMLFRFFVREENKSSEISLIKDMDKIIKDLSNEEIDNIKYEFKILQKECSNKLENIKNIMIEIINQMIQLYKNNSESELNNLKYTIKNNNDNKNEFEDDLILKLKIPKNIINKGTESIIQYFNDKYKNNDSKDFINIVKILNDTNQFMKTTKGINDKVYIYNMTSLNEEKKKNLETKIDLILKNFELKFEEKLSNLEQEIISPKDNISIYPENKSLEKFQSDPKLLIYKKDICTNAHTINSIDRVFCAFKSFSGEALVAWGTNKLAIEIYDCEQNKVIKTIYRAHNQTIYSCRHYPDMKQKIDYIITSSYDKSIKVWNIKQDNEILRIPNVHNNYYIYSVSLLIHNQEHQNYIITSATNEKMKIWDFNGVFLRNFGIDTESTYFIDVYYKKSTKEYFIINANNIDVKSYEFSTGNLYHRYKTTPSTWHMSAIVNDVKDKQILIESDGNGYIRLWDFNTAELLKAVYSKVSLNLRGICLWNDRYLFASGNDNQVKLFDLEEGLLIQSFKGHTSTVCTIEKINHPLYGECMLSQALEGKIKLWVPPEK